MQKVQMGMNTVFILVGFYLVFVLDENNSKFRKKIRKCIFCEENKKHVGRFFKVKNKCNFLSCPTRVKYVISSF